ncbi:hypothetical protein [Neobacillus vireti]|uniref:hypothetical protein n=1 Tax=Neobacillus vireti TaxID=220686 RepID=UPI002FFFE27C
MVSIEKKTTVERWFHEYFTEGNLRVIDELTTPDFVNQSRNGDNSREKMKDFMSWYRSVFQED